MDLKVRVGELGLKPSVCVQAFWHILAYLSKIFNNPLRLQFERL